MDIMKEFDIRQHQSKAVYELLVTEIQDLIDQSKDDAWINEQGAMFSAGVRYGLMQVIQTIKSEE